MSETTETEVDDTRVETLVVEWPVSSLDALEQDEHPELTFTVTVAVATDARIQATGPRKALAYWVTMEHFGGDYESANELMKLATPAREPATCCQRCGDQHNRRETVELCELCGDDVTGRQARELLAVVATLATVANPNRTRV